MSFSTFREQFDPLLLKVLTYQRARLPAVHDTFLQEILAYPDTLLGHGKRIRPYIASLAIEGLGGELTEPTLEYLTSLEIFHLFCLIHDDLIDEGTMRHGVPTTHCFVAERLQELQRIGSTARLSEAYALLLGDLLLAWSLELMQRNHLGSKRAQTRGRELFYQMVNETMIGQVIDVDLTSKLEASTALIEQKMCLKTARYTFTRPLQLGANLVRWSKPVERFCEEFGESLGTAFQIQDDLLDLLGDSAKTKKMVFSDLATRQHTLYTQHVFEHGIAADKDLLDSLFGHPLSLQEQEQARELFERTGATTACFARIETEFARATKFIERATFLQNKPAFYDLIAFIRARAS